MIDSKQEKFRRNSRVKTNAQLSGFITLFSPFLPLSLCLFLPPRPGPRLGASGFNGASDEINAHLFA